MNCWEEIKFKFTDYCSVAIFSSFFYVKSRISIRPAAWETVGVLSFPLPWFRIAVIQTIYSPHPLTCAAGRKLPHSGNILEALQNYRTIHLKILLIWLRAQEVSHDASSLWEIKRSSSSTPSLCHRHRTWHQVWPLLLRAPAVPPFPRRCGPCTSMLSPCAPGPPEGWGWSFKYNYKYHYKYNN